MGRHGNGAVSRYGGNGNHTHGITKWLNEYHTTFLSEPYLGLVQPQERRQEIALARRAGDSGDGSDSDFRIPCRCHPYGRTPRNAKCRRGISPALFGRVKSPLRSEKSLDFSDCVYRV